MKSVLFLIPLAVICFGAHRGYGQLPRKDVRKAVPPGPRSEKDFKEGDGTKQKPFTISSVKELDNVRHYSNRKDIHFQLRGNFVLPASFESIPQLAGTFDGANFTLTGFNHKEKLDPKSTV